MYYISENSSQQLDCGKAGSWLAREASLSRETGCNAKALTNFLTRLSVSLWGQCSAWREASCRVRSSEKGQMFISQKSQALAITEPLASRKSRGFSLVIQSLGSGMETSGTFASWNWSYLHSLRWHCSLGKLDSEYCSDSKVWEAWGSLWLWRTLA